MANGKKKGGDPAPTPKAKKVTKGQIQNAKVTIAPKIIMCQFEGCHEVFNTKSQRKEHKEKMRHYETYDCEEEGCTESFRNLRALARHQIQSHPLDS